MSRNSDSDGDRTAPIAMLAGGIGQNIQDTSFVAAARDVNIIAITIGQTTSPLRSRFIQPILNLFQSPEHRGALRHGSQIQRILDFLRPGEPAGHGDPDVQAANNAGRDPSPGEPGHQSSFPCSSSNSQQVHVTSIEDVDSESFQSPNSTKAEIYIQSMLKSSGHHGLACWSPKPREPLVNGKGVIPGDVGTFSAGYGFRKFFNIWEGELGERLMAAASTHQFPSGGVRIYPTELEEGQAIFHGTSSSVHRTPDGSISSFEFHCCKEPGAVLACTSDADLEQLTDQAALRDFIIHHAGLIYQHADSIQRVDESLYIVTGCIKSHSWAIAAYRDMAHAPHNELKLVKVDSSGGPGILSLYNWTRLAMAEVRRGHTIQSTQGNHGKDQALFLQGFKLALSDEFRSKLRGSLYKPDSGAGSGTGSHSKPRDETDRDASDRPSNEGSGGSVGGGGVQGGLSPNSVAGRNLCLNADATQVETFPLVAEAIIHPCDAINNLLLDATGADFALSHDDDWRFTLGGSLWTDNSCVEIAMSKRLCVRNGIAYLENNPDSNLQFPAAAPTNEKSRFSSDSSEYGVSHNAKRIRTQNSPSSNSQNLPKSHRTSRVYGVAKEAQADPELSLTGSLLSPSGPLGTHSVPHLWMSHPLRGSPSERKEDKPLITDDHPEGWLVKPTDSLKLPGNREQTSSPSQSSSTSIGYSSGNWNWKKDIRHCNKYELDISGDDQFFLDVRLDDLIIVVMGMTGAGKSTFINRFCGEELMEVNHGLRSCTSRISVARCTLPPTHQLWPCRRLILVDTPGFDHTDIGEYEILRRISVWLASVYNVEIKITGLVYLHSIGNSRMRGSSLLSHDIFRSMCGANALTKVVMASTQWETILHQPAAGPIREKGLKDFWSNTLDQGAVYMRVEVPEDDPRRDTQRVIDYILERHAVATQIQQELVELNKRVAETEAAQKLKEALFWDSREEQLKEFPVEPGFVDWVKGLFS